jgi:hypothetical protein
MKIGSIVFFERRIIGGESGTRPLMVRYILLRTAPFGIYLHQFLRSDYDRALHDHPWPFVSILLLGGYFEVHDQTIDGSQIKCWREPCSVLLRPAEWRHRVVLEDGKTAWSLVIVGRRLRRWGFFLSSGWCWWRKFDSAKGICADGVLWRDGSD